MLTITRAFRNEGDSRASLCSSDLMGVVTGSVTPPARPPTHRPAPSPFGRQLWKHADDIIHSETSCVCHTTTDLPPRINNPMTVCSSPLSLMELSTLSSAGPHGDHSLKPEFHSQILSFFPQSFYSCRCYTRLCFCRPLVPTSSTTSSSSTASCSCT